MRFKLGLGFLLAALALCGCGGGGSSSSSGSPDLDAALSATSLQVPPGSNNSVVASFLNAGQGEVSLSVTGLPSGVTCVPASFTSLMSFSEPIAFAASPQVSGNFSVNFVFQVGSATKTIPLTLNISPLQSSTLRTNFVPVGGSLPSTIYGPRAIVYDQTHKHVFVADPFLNRVDVLSSVDGSRVTTIPVVVPSSIDISQDNSRVYVATMARQIDVIDTTALAVIERVTTPCYSSFCSTPMSLVVTSNGTALVNFGGVLAQWNLSTNSFAPVSGPGIPGGAKVARSRDYSTVLINGTAVYNAGTNTITASAQSSPPNVGAIAVNSNGTQFAVAANPGVLLFDSSFNQLASIATATTSTPSVMYSRDGSLVYFCDFMANGNSYNAPVIRAVSTSTFQDVGQTPDINIFAPFFTPYTGRLCSIPEDVDETGMIFGASDEGVSFLDVTQLVNLTTPGPTTYSPFLGTPFPMFPYTISPITGPIAGGTAATVIGSGFAPPATVFFGKQQAPVAVASPTQILTATPAQTAGPVNITSYFADGWLSVVPDGFTYGPTILSISGTVGNPQGGDTIFIYGYGFGSGTASGGSAATVTIGGQPSPSVQFLTTYTVENETKLYDPDPFPVQGLQITTPPGTPGLADIAVTTPAGSTTMAGAFHYLQSIQVYPHGGTLSFLTYDKTRQRIYLSNASEIEVFDLTSQQFLSPLIPPGGPYPLSLLLQSTLTPDGSTLAVADSGESAVYLFNLVSNTAKVVSLQSPPSRLAATSTGQLIAGTYDINLATLAVSQLQPQNVQVSGLIEADAAGDTVYFDPYTVWNVATNTFTSLSSLGLIPTDTAVSADGNVLVAGGASSPSFFDSNGILINQPYYSNYLALTGNAGSGNGSLNFVPGENLHPSGSLFYQPREMYQLAGQQNGSPPYPSVGAVDLIDVLDGQLRDRIVLTEPLLYMANVNALKGSYLAIDEYGQRLFALTQSGLTIAQLSVVPLSIGSVTPNQGPASGGTQVQIRGSGFQSGATINFGGTQVFPTVTDMDTLTFTTPSAAQGAVQIKITNPNGTTYSLDDAFTTN